MENVVVMGHVPADTDSVCSPIVYAWFLKNFKGLNAKACISGKLNKETTFVLNALNVEVPELIDSLSPGTKLVLVDTNNPEELVLGHNQAEIIEIVDHHKLAGLTTVNPATITIRPYACSATVIWDLMHNNAKESMPKEIAGLMLAAIISDTLNFTSPTTTDVDRKAAEEIQKIAQLNIDDFANQMFAAKSDLSGLSAKDILLLDSKDFELSGSKYKVSVLETTNPSNALNQIADIKLEVSNLRSTNNLKGIFFFIVDILKSEATLVLESEQEKQIAQKAFSKELNGDLMHLPGVVSRKKQMIPNIENAVRALG